MPRSISKRLRPHRLTFLIWLSVLAAACLWFGTYAELDGASLLGDHPEMFIVFALLLVATELKPMPSLTDDTELTASWAFAFTLLFTAPTAGALAAVGIAPIIGDLRRRKRFDRTLFNAAQFMLSLEFGGLVGSLVGDLSAVADGEPVSLRWLIAVSLACAAGFAANSVFISVAIAFHMGLPVKEMLHRSLGINLSMDGLLLALAPVFVVIGLEALILVPLMLLTVWIIFRSAALALRNKHDATHDQLTGIANRRLFEDHAAMIIEQSKTTGQPFALVHIDLDGFKGINDRLGHHYGDLVLVEVAARLKAGERATDQSARLGGDEFALLIADIGGSVDAENVARRLLGLISAPLDIDGVPLTVGASMGVALFPDHGEDVNELLHHADIAMYEAKACGGGVRVFEGIEESPGPPRFGLLTDLTRAMENGELSLAYQPKVDLDTGRISTVEALLRWHHPTHGAVRPGWFMPQVEQTDLINALTDHVIDMALDQCRQWAEDGISVSIAVNVSARNLHDLKFPERVARKLADQGLDPSVLEIEITENAVMEDPIRSSAVLSRLRAVGVTLAIDDFGTGYSSLSVLRDLEVDRIKIDRSFVTNLALNDGDLTIVRSVIELGHNLGLRAVAEGVETIEAMRVLQAIGCDEVQGFLLAKPVAAAELTPLLRIGRVDLSELAATEVLP